MAKNNEVDANVSQKTSRSTGTYCEKIHGLWPKSVLLNGSPSLLN